MYEFQIRNLRSSNVSDFSSWPPGLTCDPMLNMHKMLCHEDQLHCLLKHMCREILGELQNEQCGTGYCNAIEDSRYMNYERASNRYCFDDRQCMQNKNFKCCGCCVCRGHSEAGIEQRPQQKRRLDSGQNNDKKHMESMKKGIGNSKFNKKTKFENCKGKSGKRKAKVVLSDDESTRKKRKRKCNDRSDGSAEKIKAKHKENPSLKKRENDSSKCCKKVAKKEGSVQNKLMRAYKASSCESGASVEKQVARSELKKEQQNLEEDSDVSAEENQKCKLRAKKQIKRKNLVKKKGDDSDTSEDLSLHRLNGNAQIALISDLHQKLQKCYLQIEIK